MDCSLPGSCIRGILQAGTLEWVDISFTTKTGVEQWDWKLLSTQMFSAALPMPPALGGNQDVLSR